LIVLQLRTPIQNFDIASLNVAFLAEALAESSKQSTSNSFDRATEKSDHRHRPPLRPRRERPRRRDADPRDELSPFYHSIT
jgi:hypothetical protein